MCLLWFVSRFPQRLARTMSFSGKLLVSLILSTIVLFSILLGFAPYFSLLHLLCCSVYFDFCPDLDSLLSHFWVFFAVLFLTSWLPPKDWILIFDFFLNASIQGYPFPFKCHFRCIPDILIYVSLDAKIFWTGHCNVFCWPVGQSTFSHYWVYGAIKPFFFFKILLITYLFKRETTKEHEWGGAGEAAPPTEQGAQCGTQTQDSGIMTGAEDHATQVP